jgi:hypothetical protein
MGSWYNNPSVGSILAGVEEEKVEQRVESSAFFGPPPDAPEIDVEQVRIRGGILGAVAGLFAGIASPATRQQFLSERAVARRFNAQQENIAQRQEAQMQFQSKLEEYRQRATTQRTLMKEGFDAARFEMEQETEGLERWMEGFQERGLMGPDGKPILLSQISLDMMPHAMTIINKAGKLWDLDPRDQGDLASIKNAIDGITVNVAEASAGKAFDRYLRERTYLLNVDKARVDQVNHGIDMLMGLPWQGAITLGDENVRAAYDNLLQLSGMTGDDFAPIREGIFRVNLARGIAERAAEEGITQGTRITGTRLLKDTRDELRSLRIGLQTEGKDDDLAEYGKLVLKLAALKGKKARAEAENDLKKIGKREFTFENHMERDETWTVAQAYEAIQNGQQIERYLAGLLELPLDALVDPLTDVGTEGEGSIYGAANARLKKGQ